MRKTLCMILAVAALTLAGCAGYRADEVRFNDILIARATTLATLAKEDAAADAEMLAETPEAEPIRRQLKRKADLADQVAALAAVLYERTHQKVLSPDELAILIRKYKEQDEWPTSRPSR